MNFRKLLVALLAVAMLLAALPLGAMANSEYYPTVQLSFLRNPSDPTKGTLIVTPTNNIPGKFVYITGTKHGEKDIVPPQQTLIELTGLPSTSNYYITYQTYYYELYPSPPKTYTISPTSGTGSGNVSIISSSRSGTDVLVSLNVIEACTFYYSGDMFNWSSVFLLPGIVPLELSNFYSNTIFYYTETYSGNKSSISSITVGSSGSGSTTSYPRLSSYSLSMASDGTIKFSYTSDKNGFVFYKISSSAVSSISPSNAITQAITSGSGSFIIDPYLFIDEISATGKEPKMYFVTADGYGNQSAVRSIELGSSSTVTGYPVLSNCSFVMTAPNKGTFSCTSDKAGTIFYTVATSSPGSAFNPTGYYTLKTGSNSFTIEDSKLSLSGAKVYYYTFSNSGNNSPVQSVSVGTSHPVLSNVQYAVGQYNQYYGGYGGIITFTSNADGILYYSVTSDIAVSKNSPIFTTDDINKGTNTVPVIYTNPMQYSAPLYFYTRNYSQTSESPLAYILPNTGTVIPIPDSSAASTVSSVEIKNVVAPVVGATPSAVFTTSDDRYTVSNIEWYNNTLDRKMHTGDIFLPGNSYSVIFTLNAKSGYSFPTYPTNLTAKINGKNATLVNYTGSSIAIKYTFDTLAGTLPATEIKTVTVNGIADPVAGQAPDTTGTPGDSSYHIGSINWNPTTTQFKAGASYTVEITLVPANGYKFNVESAKIGYRNAKIESKSADKVVISYNYWVNPFIDIREYDVEPTPGNPNGVPNRYYVFIKYCYLNKLFYGISDTTFAPDATMTRAMFVTVLGRLAGVDVASYKTDKFKDVDQKALYAPYVAWATQNNIVQGYTDGNFGPDDPVTREQMCELIRRYAVYANIPLKYTERAIAFTDASKISDYAKAAVSIFEQAGVALPRPNKTDFDPKENAMRKEIAEMLILFMMKYMND